jgi:hypothetical protein
MTRLLSFAGTCFLLFSFLAIGIGAAPAQATIYDFTATAVPGFMPQTSGFTLQYNDTDNDGLFDLVELISFSGITYTGVGTYTTITTIPYHEPVYGPLTDGVATINHPWGADRYWYFEIPGLSTISLLGSGLTYEQQASPVPVPPGVLLLGSGLLGLVGWRRLKNG